MQMQISEIRVFNQSGNERFISLLTERPSDIVEQLNALIFDDAFTQKSVLKMPFAVPKTRLDVGKELFKYLGPDGPLRSESRNPALWNWLAAACMPGLLGNPTDINAIKATERWVLNQASFKYYRHLLAGAYFAYEPHASDPSKAMAILCQDILTPGEIVAQIQGTDDLAYSVGAEVATMLYFESSTGKIKIGAGGKGPGSARRLATDFLNQIRLTVDFKGMKAEEIVDLLPPEFDRYKAEEDNSPAHEDLDEETYDFDDFRDQLNM
jgi:hypothetical protein